MEIPPRTLDGPDARLAAAAVTAPDDREAPHDLVDLAARVGADVTLLTAVADAGLLLPHHVDGDGNARYSEADAVAVRAGIELLEAGLPLGELLDLAGPTDTAMREVAELAVDGFLRFIRDPAVGALVDPTEAADRLVTAYERMLPASVTLVAHHFRRCLLQAAAQRFAADGG
jgi:hypothetical protein